MPALLGTRQRARNGKEIRALLREPKRRQILLQPPFILLLFASFAATVEVRNEDIGVLDRSGGRFRPRPGPRPRGRPATIGLVLDGRRSNAA